MSLSSLNDKFMKVLGFKGIEWVFYLIWVFISIDLIRPETPSDIVLLIGGIILPIIVLRSKRKSEAQKAWKEITPKEKIQILIISIISIIVGALVGWAIIHYFFTPLSNIVSS